MKIDFDTTSCDSNCKHSHLCHYLSDEGVMYTNTLYNSIIKHSEIGLLPRYLIKKLI